MKRVLHLALTSMLVFSAFYLSAQPPPPPNDGTVGASVDSGALVLLIAIAGYGYMRLKQKEQSVA
jgi:hypothetical protein